MEQAILSLPGSALNLTSRETPSGCLIEAVGELDMTTALDFERSLALGIHAVAEAEAATSLSVDLREVDFIDSAGLALLVEARRRLAPSQRSLRVLLTPGRQPDRVLRRGGFGIIMALTYDEDGV